MGNKHGPEPLRFDLFEVNPASGELRRQGHKVKLHDKSFQILLALLDRPGEMVTREELQQRLWPEDTHVEFDNNLNNAVCRLREALGDSADDPRFIETLPRRGYRFLAEAGSRLPVESAAPPAVAPPPSAVTRWWRWPLLATIGAAVALAALAYRSSRHDGPRLDSLAVLPFVSGNAADDSLDDYLAFGMTEALTAELARIGSLRVISQTSAMQYKRARKSLPDIARELGVNAVVEGSVVRDGNAIRVTVQLIEAATDTHLWAQTYQRELRGILSMQTEIARAIAREVHATLTAGEQAALNTDRQVDPAAHEAYLRGRYFWRKRTEEGIRKALSYFEQAVAFDPSYAPAYAGLSDVYWDLASGLEPDPGERRSVRQKARVAADRALELDDTLADAHTARGYILLHFDWDLEGAERAFRKAIALNPNDEVAHGGLGECFLARSKPQEALKQALRAYELNPMTPLSNRGLGNFLSYAGDHDRAIEQLRKASEMEPDDAVAHVSLGQAYLQKGLHEEAMGEFQKAVRASDSDWALAILAYGHAVTGDRAEALRILRPVEGRGQTPPLELAIAYAALGDNDRAFASLTKGYEERDSGLIGIRIMPQLASLRSDPRFEELLRRMNLPE